MAKRALITGITGQDGSYLTELLLGKGYDVHGIVRRASTFNTGRLEHLYRDPHDDDVRGSLEVGKLADLAVLSGDYLTVPLDQIGRLESLLTLVGGEVVYAAGPFAGGGAAAIRR